MGSSRHPWCVWIGLLVVGCNSYEFDDSVVEEYRPSSLIEGAEIAPINRLYTPYVAGAQVEVRARDSGWATDFTGWSLVSTDAEVFALGRSRVGELELAAIGHARQAGVARLLLIDPARRVVAEQQIEVRTPTRLELRSRLHAIAGEATEDVEGIEVLAGGTASFRAHYFDGDTRLYGIGALEVSSADDAVLTAEALPEDVYIGEAEELLRLYAAAPGAASISLSIGGAPIEVRPVAVVDEDAIASIELVGGEESTRRLDERVTVIARAFDRAGVEVFGVDYRWTTDLEVLEAEGDVLRYHYDPAVELPLTARRGPHTAAILGHGRSPDVGSSNRLSACSIGGDAAPWWALGVLALRPRRRRLRRRRALGRRDEDRVRGFRAASERRC